ncbi:hypothetical protein LXL04_003733 [Taraxacum kok-saghyz]
MVSSTKFARELYPQNLLQNVVWNTEIRQWTLLWNYGYGFCYDKRDHRSYYGNVTMEIATESLLQILQWKDSYRFYNGSVPTDTTGLASQLLSSQINNKYIQTSYIKSKGIIPTKFATKYDVEYRNNIRYGNLTMDFAMELSIKSKEFIGSVLLQLHVLYKIKVRNPMILYEYTQEHSRTLKNICRIYEDHSRIDEEHSRT